MAHVVEQRACSPRRCEEWGRYMSLDTISLTRGSKVPSAIYTSSAEPVCVIDSMSERNDDAELARRIVACWNACRGIETDFLEAIAAELGTLCEQPSSAAAKGE